MSMRCFLALEKPLQKTEYYYKYILPTMSKGDMFYNDKMFFEKNLTDCEKETLGNVFNDFCVYAIYSGFQLDYEPRYKQDLSVSTAKNALEELKWFKSFAKKKLLQQDVFMVLNLWLGRKTEFDRLKMIVIDVNDWELDEDKHFVFEYGTIYQFVDNSEEAILKRKQRSQKFN